MSTEHDGPGIWFPRNCPWKPFPIITKIATHRWWSETGEAPFPREIPLDEKTVRLYTQGVFASHPVDQLPATPPGLAAAHQGQIMTPMDQLPLGQPTQYTDRYDNRLLCPVPRSLKRQELGLGEPLPFVGEDQWNGYELSWLNPKGKPSGCSC